MDPNYIIVQAGGKGSRMESLTRNKPKALVPVNNLPMIFHLFRKYPDKKYIIVGDYKYDVLVKYLKAFADVDYTTICATGKIGTCAGLEDALREIPENKSFMLIWCDLLLSDDYRFPAESGNYVGISKDFICRWSYSEGKFFEEKSSQHGVAGHFIFENKSVLNDIPDEGEFVAWLGYKKIDFKEQALYETREYGLYSEWDKLPKLQCRPFNEIIVKDGSFIKRPIDEQGEELAAREIYWYQKIRGFEKNGGVSIPDIHNYEPLTMGLIDGKNIYEYDSISYREKESILEKIITSLKNLHNLESIPVDRSSYYDAYIGKTKKRLDKVKALVPFADRKTIIINGIQCRNVFYCWDEIEKMVMSYMPDKYVLLHGDCTFSNIMLDSTGNPVLIDPRGYFGNTELYGDEAYDWVKLYYSLYSNYDRFNLKKFSLSIDDNSISVQTESNHWEDMEDVFFDMVGSEISRKQMKLFLSIVWLSLTTYAWDDYDSICGAFYYGLFYLEEAFLMSDEGIADRYFGKTLGIIEKSLHSMDMNRFEDLIDEVESTLMTGHKVIASGLGKNVPVCEKFVGTMLSLGLDANFLHTNSAIHGDMGMVKKGDLIIILSKSGETTESIYFTKLIMERAGVNTWVLVFEDECTLVRLVGKDKSLVIPMEHEGDPWNIVPNNSTTLNLIVLQGLAMSLAERMSLTLEDDFKPNHPGGAIGERLSEK